MSYTYKITKEKLKSLKEELDYLKNVKRAEIAQKLDEAKALGDLKENAEYHEARNEQSKVEDRIAEIEEILDDYEIIKHKKGDKVEIGSEVKLEKKKKRKKEEVTYNIVGIKEVDVFNNRISFLSPLGKELMGKKKGDEFVFTNLDGEEVKYKILDIK